MDDTTAANRASEDPDAFSASATATECGTSVLLDGHTVVTVDGHSSVGEDERLVKTKDENAREGVPSDDRIAAATFRAAEGTPSRGTFEIVHENDAEVHSAPAAVALEHVSSIEAIDLVAPAAATHMATATDVPTTASDVPTASQSLTSGDAIPASSPAPPSGATAATADTTDEASEPIYSIDVTSSATGAPAPAADASDDAPAVALGGSATETVEPTEGADAASLSREDAGAPRGSLGPPSPQTALAPAAAAAASPQTNWLRQHGWTVATVTLGVLVALAAIGLSSFANGPPVPAPPQRPALNQKALVPVVVRHADVALIFVHGYASDDADIWTVREFGPAAWLTQDFPEASIYLFAYDAVTANPSDVASQFLRAVVASHLVAERLPIVVMAHGLGGHIVKTALANCGGVLDAASSDTSCLQLQAQVRGVLFLGTPHRIDGGTVAMARHLLGDAAPASMLAAALTDMEHVNRGFLRLRIPSVSFAEAVPVPSGPVVVPYEAAAALALADCLHTVVTWPVDHYTLAAPPAPTDIVYLAIQHVLWQLTYCPDAPPAPRALATGLFTSARAVVLCRIEGWLRGTRPTASTPALKLVVTGPVGVGKRTLCAHALANLLPRRDTAPIETVTLQGQSMDALHADVQRWVSSSLNEVMPKTVGTLVAWLNSPARTGWIVYITDVTDARVASWLDAELAKVLTGGTLVVTSSLRDVWGVHDWITVPVAPLATLDALAVLTAATTTAIAGTPDLALVSALGGLPLVLQAAARFVREHQLHWSAYQKACGGDDDGRHVPLCDGSIVATYRQLIVDHVTSTTRTPNTRRLCQLLQVLGAAAIPKRVLAAASGADDVHGALASLRASSLVSVEDDLVSCDPVFQDAMAAVVPCSQDVAHALSVALQTDIDQDTGLLGEQSVAPATSLLLWMQRRFPDLIERARLERAVGLAAQRQGHLAEATTHYSAAWAAYKAAAFDAVPLPERLLVADMLVALSALHQSPSDSSQAIADAVALLDSLPASHPRYSATTDLWVRLGASHVTAANWTAAASAFRVARGRLAANDGTAAATSSLADGLVAVHWALEQYNDLCELAAVTHRPNDAHRRLQHGIACGLAGRPERTVAVLRSVAMSMTAAAAATDPEMQLVVHLRTLEALHLAQHICGGGDEDTAAISTALDSVAAAIQASNAAPLLLATSAGVLAPQDAVRWWQAAASGGQHPSAALFLARCHRYGNCTGATIAHNVAAAEHWYRWAFSHLELALFLGARARDQPASVAFAEAVQLLADVHASGGPPSHVAGQAAYALARLYERTEPAEIHGPLALRWYAEAAKRGMADAFAGEGAVHCHGRGTPVNNATAQRLFRLGLEKGSPRAVYALGLCCTADGACADGEPRRRGDAFVHKAASLGDVDALTELCTLAPDQPGTNDTLAWCMQAVQAGGAATAAAALGNMYHSGGLAQAVQHTNALYAYSNAPHTRAAVHVQRNRTTAVAWYRRAAFEVPAAALMLGYYSYHGLGGLPASTADAVRWYQEAADGGDRLAMTLLGECHERGEVGPANTTEALRWYYLAGGTIDGDARAQYNIANTYYRQQKYADAYQWYDKAASNEFGKAANMAGILYQRGLGVTRNPRMAKVYFEAAAAQWYPPAMKNLADCYYCGEGVRMDTEAGKEWYMRARDRGLACAVIGRQECMNVGRVALSSHDYADVHVFDGDKDA